jgi:hypothetical protein
MPTVTERSGGGWVFCIPRKLRPYRLHADKQGAGQHQVKTGGPKWISMRDS